MLKLLADENFDNTIVRGLLRRRGSIDIVRVQDIGLSGKDDPTILAWAAEEDKMV
jgi:predicted nuclease of predicted toxin-antitoxin system